VDLKTATALRRLRLVSAPEAVSFLLLHVVFWADAWRRAKWPLKTAALYFVLSVLPTGGFFAERKLKRAAEDEVIASRARQEGIVNA
jgi:hypothetical protein